jgi:hypothetical protein
MGTHKAGAEDNGHPEKLRRRFLGRAGNVWVLVVREAAKPGEPQGPPPTLQEAGQHQDERAEDKFDMLYKILLLSKHIDVVRGDVGRG